MYNSNPAFGQQPAAAPGYGYPPPPGGSVPQQPGGYPPHQGGYPPQQGGHVPSPGAHPQGGYPDPSGPVGSSTPPGTGDDGGFASDPMTLFAEKAIRQAFVSKVFSILTIQLAFTSILIGFFVLNSQTQKYFNQSPGWMFVGMGVFLVSYLILACVESARRAAPCNMILLMFLTLGYGLMAAVISCHYETTTVLYAFIATGASCFLITMFAKTTSYDVTGCGTGLCLLSLAHMVIGLLMIAILAPLGYLNIVNLLISISGAFLASMFLVFDVQLIMGGKKCELSPEEYILASVMLYIDIMQIFLYLLQIFGQLGKD